MREIPVGKRGLVALVDDQDYESVSAHSWNVERGRSGVLYAVCQWMEGSKRCSIKMHNFVLGVRGVDHIDHNGLNNQRSNLRPADQSQNQMNARKRSGCASKYKGVSWFEQSKKWGAKIGLNGRRIWLGLHETEELAARAYDRAALEHFGAFAHLNFPAERQALGGQL